MKIKYNHYFTKFNISLLWLITLASCSSTFIALPSEKMLLTSDEEQKVIYVAADFGSPSQELSDVIKSIGRDTCSSKKQPFILGAGDNLYTQGFPLLPDHATNNKIIEIAKPFLEPQYQGKPVPLVFVPGNHDYNGDAITKQRSWGNIAQWYFLSEITPSDSQNLFTHWHPYPGTKEIADSNSRDLYQRIYSDPKNIVEFMKPTRVDTEITGNSIALIAIDSQLIIDLFYNNYDELAYEYLRALKNTLQKNQNNQWLFVVAHHPLETYGKHRPGKIGNFILGPGWPQFPQLWHKIVTIPPLGTIATLGWWGVHYRQDIHSCPYEKYRTAVYKIINEAKVDLFIAGHDHVSQIIDLDDSFGSKDNTKTIQLISGEAAKKDPVTSGKGTIFYHTGNGFAKVIVFSDFFAIEIKDRHGEHLYQYIYRK